MPISRPKSQNGPENTAGGVVCDIGSDVSDGIVNS